PLSPRSRSISRRTRTTGTPASFAGLEKKFRWRRPRHTLKGRQTPGEVERVGLRLQLRKQQAEAGDIVLLYGDESEALTHPYLARAWAQSGADLRVPAPGQAKKMALLGSLDHVSRQVIVHTSPTKRSSDFVALYNAEWLIEKNGYRSPLGARAAWLDTNFRRAA
ncbi:MAG: transposase, partial [Acetobacteraceae bacterium]|nr:transposase [Acetobacteraceae bacterium]